MNPKDLLFEGKKILDQFMENNGFRFILKEEGKGSGGQYVVAGYIKGKRKLEFHVRYTLGLVSYTIGNYTLMHEDYMRLLDIYGKNKYPGFSDSPIDGFNDLLYDLKHFCGKFISGDSKNFVILAKKLKKDPSMFKGLPK